MCRYDLRSGEGERGIFLVLMTALAFVLLMLAALVIGIGYLSTDKSRYQNVLNLAALAALETYARLPEGDSFDSKTDRARDRANEILRSNDDLPGIKSLLGNLERHGESIADSGGEIRFGNWFTEDPDGAGPETHCASGYPCWEPLDGSGTLVEPAGRVTAVRIFGNTQPSNPVIVPFATLFGSDRFQLSATVTATIVQRCVAFLVDMSKSATQETHDPNALGLKDTGGGTFEFRVSKPNAGLFAIQMDNLRDNLDPDKLIDCSNTNTWRHGKDNRDAIYYCYLNSNPALEFRNSSTSPASHFLNDYPPLAASDPFDPANWDQHVIKSDAGPMLLDWYMDPSNAHYGAEPLSRYMLAFNVALRRLLKEGSGGDRVMMMAVRGAIDPSVDRIPSGLEPQKLDRRVGLFVQMTNMQNRGKAFVSAYPPTAQGSIEQHFPNFVEETFIPYFDPANTIKSQTNLAQGLWEAMGTLGDPAQCPVTAQKAIVLATDGVSTCWNDYLGGGLAAPKCRKRYFDGSASNPDYLKAEKELIKFVLPELKKREIALTVMLDGRNVEPNFMNRARADGSCCLEPDEALANGYEGVDESAVGQPEILPYAAKSFFNMEPYPPVPICAPAPNPQCPMGPFVSGSFGRDETAYRTDGEVIPGGPYAGNLVRFRRVNGILGHMALKTNGIWCPLMDPCPAGSPRVVDTPQTCAYNGYTKAEQAQDCTLRTIGLNPFILVEEES